MYNGTTTITINELKKFGRMEDKVNIQRIVDQNSQELEVLKDTETIGKVKYSDLDDSLLKEYETDLRARYMMYDMQSYKLIKESREINKILKKRKSLG